MPLHELICTEVWGENGTVHADLVLPGMRGVIFSSACGGEKGSDVYYATACSSGLIGRFCLADVAGHGEEVARISGRLHDVMRRNMERRDPSRVFSAMNRRVDEFGLEALTTAACINYHALRGELRHCNAGHPPILVWRRSHPTWTPLSVRDVSAARFSNLPFGVSPDTRYAYESLPLGEGARLMVYSDGVLETPSPDRELFGSDRLVQTLSDCEGRTLPELVERLLERLRGFAGRTDFDHDDVTFAVFEIQPHDRRPLLYHLVRNQVRK